MSAHEENDLAIIQPLIVPSNYIETGFDLPHVKLANPEFLVCWVKNYADSNSYILREEYERLEKYYAGWQQIAVENLRKADYFHKYSQVDDNGKLLWIAFMNEEDAVSSSKVLLHPELCKLFPEGYEVGIPNRVVGFVVSKACPEEERNKVAEMVASMYEMHGSPMSTQLFDSNDFLLPEQLTAPIDKELSEGIVEFVQSR